MPYHVYITEPTTLLEDLLEAAAGKSAIVSLGSPYLIEKNLKSGTVISCPNNRKTAPEEDLPKRRKKKGEQESTVKCDYSRAAPTPEPSVVA